MGAIWISCATGRSVSEVDEVILLKKHRSYQRKNNRDSPKNVRYNVGDSLVAIGDLDC